MTSNTVDSLRRFSEVCEDIKNTSSKNEKLRILSNYLRRLDDESLKIACRLFSGEIFPPEQDLEFQIGYSTLVGIIMEICGIDDEYFKKVYLEHGDLGEVAEKILAKKTVEPLFKKEYVLIKFYEELKKLATIKGKGSFSEKKKLLKRLYLNMSPLEAKYLTKIITGEMRIGLVAGLVVEGLAQAYVRKYEEVNEAYLLINDLGDVALLAKYDKLREATLEPLHQTNFMLAEAMQTAEEIEKYFEKQLICEYKLDGVRVQCHKKDEVVRIFTRRGRESSTSFPEIVNALKKISHDYIIDGEIIAFRDERPLPFSLLQHRLQRKEITEKLMKEVPLTLFTYDVLYLDGEVLYKKTLVERKKALEKLQLPEEIKLLEYTFVRKKDEIETKFNESVMKGYEGVMLKDPDSFYTVGKRGKNWVKLKKELDTLDVVVVAAEKGHGKRASIFSDYVFAVWDGNKLKSIGKAYSGLTDEELTRMDERLRQYTTRDDGWRIIVKPEIVLEVTFNGLQKSSRHESGFALRFPRIKRIRDDKSIDEADTLERVRAIYKSQLIKE